MIVFTHPCMQTHKNCNFLRWKKGTASTKLLFVVDTNFTAIDTGPLIFPCIKSRVSWPGPHLWGVHLLSASLAPLCCAAALLHIPSTRLCVSSSPGLGRQWLGKQAKPLSQSKHSWGLMWYLHRVTTSMTVHAYLEEASTVPPSVTHEQRWRIKQMWRLDHQSPEVSQITAEANALKLHLQRSPSSYSAANRIIYSYTFSAFPQFT